MTSRLPVRSLQARFARAAAGLATFSAVLVTLAAMAVLLHEARLSIDQGMEMKSLLVRERLSTLGAVIDDTAALSRSSLVATALTDSAGREGYLRPFLEERTRGEQGSFALLDYRGRMIFTTTRDGATVTLAEEVAAALAADHQGKSRVAKIVRTPVGATLIVGFPVFFAYSADVVGMLVRVLPVEALIGRISFEMGEEITFEVSSEGQVVFSDEVNGGNARRAFSLGIAAAGGPMPVTYAIGFRENPFVRQVINLVTVAFVTTGAFMILAVAAARRLARRLTYRLDRLVEACSAFARGERAPIERDGIEDEIGILSASLERAFEDRRAAESQLLFIARHDVLTGLPNRAWFEDQVRAATDRASRAGSKLAVLFIDLDRFKPINDHFGHPAGDEVLQHVANRLGERLRRTDVVSRRGGDEFMVLLDPVRSPGEALAVAEALVERVKEPIVLSTGETVHTGATIGISMFPEDATSLDGLVRNADAALYLGKADGRGRAGVYSSATAEAAEARYRLETRLREALRDGGLAIAYQPQIRLSDGVVVGWEALLRWTDAELGVVSPATIISVAEETGLIHALGEWITRRAFLQNRELMELTQKTAPRLAINISARQFQQPELLERLVEIAAETGFPLDRLEVEVTESALLQGSTTEDKLLRALESSAVNIAIDDFGVGHSSLGRLRRLPIDRLKIDAGFVRQMVEDVESKEIVRAIITMGHALGLDVLAEGVENDEQRRMLRELGCDCIQGYLVCRPVPINELREFVLSTTVEHRSENASA